LRTSDTIDFSSLLNLEAIEFDEEAYLEPPQYPPTVLDCERSKDTECFDMHLPLADPCPECGAFRYMVGDWACYGKCGICYEEDMKAYEEENKRQRLIYKDE